MAKQDCPLCNSPAGYEADDYGRRKKFDCPKCKYFFISPSTEKRIAELSDKERMKLSEQSSKCRGNDIFRFKTDDGIVHGDCEPE